MTGIVRVEVGRFNYDLVGEFKFFKAGARPTILVRLTDANGVQGWGQSVPVETWTYETVESGRDHAATLSRARLLGADPADLADIHARMERAIRPSFSVGQPLCKAAIDLACYDLWGKQTGRTVSADSRRREAIGEVKLSWTVNTPTIAERRDRSWRRASRRATTTSTSRSAIRRHRITIFSWCARFATSRPAVFTGPTRIPAMTSTTALRDGAEARRCRPQGARIAAAAEPACATTRRSSGRARCPS